jgi:4a-hydroxytetrahydrobiopterin dehydratase
MGNAKIIGEAEVLQRLKTLPGWELDGASIRRKFTFAGFPDALAFVVRLGFGAEAADHHPDILVNYKRVTLTYTTHSEGGLTDKDFDGAAKAGGLAVSMGGE